MFIKNADGYTEEDILEPNDLYELELEKVINDVFHDGDENVGEENDEVLSFTLRGKQWVSLI